MEKSFIYHSPVGPLCIVVTEDDRALTAIRFSNAVPSGTRNEETPLIHRACEELAEYFKGERYIFDLPLYASGTPFQQKVWAVLCRIPYGETWSYQQVAVEVGNPLACRAVGMANNRNPLSIIVPCHRVLGSNGQLVGYGGGLSVKEKLLALEQKHKL